MGRRPTSGPTRDKLVLQLVRTGIAGQVNTPRHNNLRSYRRLAQGESYYAFGLSFEREWTFGAVLALMSKRCGVVADEDYRWGIDTIDPDRTVDALEAVGDRMAVAVARGEKVMFATGHPTNFSGTYRRWKAALAANGVSAITGGHGASYRADAERDPKRRVVEWREGVAYVSDGHEPRHSHHPDGMRAILADLAERGAQWPDLVIADHGFAGAAAEAGIEVVGFADCNDPALFLAENEGKVHVCVPLDDGYDTASYAAMASYVLARAGL